MRFDQLYPEAEVGFRTADGFQKGHRLLRCVICERQTAWFSERICLYFCSPSCCEFYLRDKPPQEDGATEAPAQASGKAPRRE